MADAQILREAGEFVLALLGITGIIGAFIFMAVTFLQGQDRKGRK